MNPFDDSDPNPFATVGSGNASSSLNPFDTDGPIGSVDEEEDDLLEDDDDAPVDASVSAEASWQYLGDLPYRRIPIYNNVRWGEDSRKGPKHRSEQAQDPQYGLARFSLLQSSKTTKNFSNPRILLSKTTITKCVGCPNGGPIAIVTLPLTGGSPPASSVSTVPIRICTVSGTLLACMDFPPPISGFSNHRPYVPADLLTLGFTSRCTLVVVLKDSFCFTYNLRGEAILPPFYILEHADLLHLAHVYEGGVAVVSSRNYDAALVELLDQHDGPEYLSTVHPSARRIVPTSTTTNATHASASSANLSGGTTDALPAHFAMVTYLPTGLYAASHALQYCAVAVLPRTRTAARHPEVFLSTSDHSVIVVNSITLQCTDVNCRARIASPIVDMCFAPNGRFLACFTESSMLTVISTSFETKVLDFDTSEGSNTPPLEMKWCGEDSVVLHWKNLGILMVGPYGDWLRFPYEGMEHVFLLPEMDCCRVITDTSVEILQRVPPTTALLLRIGSIDPAAMLLDAADAFYAGGGSSNGDTTTRSMIEGGLLESAIEACTDAAKKEFDILTQKRLLRAASYGMHFSYKTLEGKSLLGGPVTGSDNDTGSSSDRILPSKTTTKFVDAARSIRILNALRHPDVGLVVTAAQWEAMTPAGVVARLVALQRPALAAAIANYLHLPNSVQLYARAAMAAAFITTAPAAGSDSEIAERAMRIIHGKDGDKNDTSSHNRNRGGYATVAMTAHAVGRPGVASLLLMLESSVAEKVPALISTGSYADALAVATTARYDLAFSI
jgi:vacuolar protein sorting-associated protein 16